LQELSQKVKENFPGLSIDIPINSQEFDV